MIYTNAYANGYKSIHGMSSIISGIPSFKDMTNAGISNRPTNEARFINNVGKNNPVFQAAQKELNRLGVPPQAQYKEAPQPSIIERLFGRFLKEN